jgi:4-hydroxythreonine-4-phosphate dehydrogenase
LAITPGEPAGIGPDLCVQIFDKTPDGLQLIYFADPVLLRERATLLGIELKVHDWSQSGKFVPGEMNVFPVNLQAQSQPGELNPANATYVIETLQAALNQCTSGKVDGLVTGPVHKGIINEAGIPFSGHTEWLADNTNTDKVVMMLCSGDLRVALATTHLPLRAVADAISGPDLKRVIQIVMADLTDKFGFQKPKLLVCGLNPHAGENGHLGTEEQNIIEPLLKELVEAGLDIEGPIPADTAFTRQRLKRVDAVLAMYHDQGLPVLKHQGFGEAVNITLGLPILRTSVDHGTALDLAGTGQADTGSFLSAIQCARDVIHRQRV